MTEWELTIAGTLLYACEGTRLRRDPRGKNRFTYSIELTNSRPEIVKLFVRFLREILNVEEQRLRGQLFIYKDHEENSLKSFWSDTSGISIDQFQKVILLRQKNSRYKPNPLGTFKVRYSSKESFIKLQQLMNNVWKGAGVL